MVLGFMVWAFPFVGNQAWLHCMLYDANVEMRDKWRQRFGFDSARALGNFLSAGRGGSFRHMSWKDVPQMYLDASIMTVRVAGETSLFLVTQIAKFVLVILLTVWNVFKMVHSEMRLMCMVDGPLGGILGVALCWQYTGVDPLSLPQGVLLLWAGGAGLLSVGLGYLNYRVIALGWLKTMKPV